jgi:hypothetical protein
MEGGEYSHIDLLRLFRSQLSQRLRKQSRDMIEILRRLIVSPDSLGEDLAKGGCSGRMVTIASLRGLLRNLR